MKRLIIFVYGILCYLLFLGTFLYMVGFIGNLWVPKSMDSPATGALGPALVVDLVLLGIFAVQHSVMARPAFKRGIRKIIPAAAERSTYVLASSLALILLVYYWQPLGGVVWNVESDIGVKILHVLFALGWALLLYSTFLINHFDLFGLRQVWLALMEREYKPVQFKQPWLYKQMRHPLYVGFFIAFWAAPTMTVTHLVFAVMASAYIVVGTLLEEHDLRSFHAEYAEYAKRVPRYIPRLFGR